MAVPKVFLQVLAVILISNGVLAAPSIQNNEINEERSNENSYMDMAMRIYDSCADEDMIVCFGGKAISSIERASKMADIEIVDGIRFVSKGVDVVNNGRALMSENEIENSIETSPSGKTARFLTMIMESMSTFFKTHSLQFKLPESVQKALGEYRDLDAPFTIPASFKVKKIFKKLATFLPLFKVAFFATNAMLALTVLLVGYIALKVTIISKIAMISGIISLISHFLRKRNMPASVETQNSYEPVSTGGWNSANTAAWANTGGYQRSLGDAHSMAFSEQAPVVEKKI